MQLHPFCHESSFHSSQVCATHRTPTIATKLRCSHVKAVYYASVCCRCRLLYCISHVLLTCLFENEDEWLMYIKVSSVCSENPTHPCSRCAGNLHSCCSWSWVSPVCSLALNISGQKASIVGSLASHAPPPSPLAGLDCGRRRRREECSYSSHSHLVCLLSSLCCVAHDEPCSHLLYFAVSWVAPFCCFKTGDVFMSLIWVPLTKVTSSHVGTVCWLRVTDRQISLSVWCYLHVIRAGNERQPVNVDKTWLWQSNKLRNPHMV